ncbi:DUF1461 domain-containing protein [Thalassolituus sp. LLYu03]|uniref:lipoprotein intramolecular transacylase Lit n=1 Tax=Thalassolituus sp. LLYu03 TaxID=3421656 RepID=UPI003D2AFD87
MKNAHQGLWFAALFALLLGCLTAGWYAQAAVDYGYRFWYGQMDIGAHIDKFGPRNRYIHGFQHTSEEERIRVFAEIVDAVHHHGEGLADIRFHTASGPHRLLREPEVQHLQDVANLIDVLSWAGLVALVAGLAAVLLLVRGGVRPRWKAQAGWLSGFVALAVALVLIIGPRQVFYQFHVWIFPEGHQWFFYYQDSLMSTLMKAPDLFGGIALAILLSGLLVFSVLLLLIGRVQRSL